MFLFAIIIIAVVVSGCGPSQPHKNKAYTSGRGADDSQESSEISRTMEVENPEGQLSSMTYTLGDEAFMVIYSVIGMGDVTRVWSDLAYLQNKTDIRKVHLLLISGGGSAFSGMALSDQIIRAEQVGFKVICHASGLVASAAVPILAVCTKRYATPGTIFMVHEPSIWKWAGRESSSDIRAQNELMDLIREKYLERLATHSNLNVEEWGEMEGRITWFSASQAKEWGLVDEIE